MKENKRLIDTRLPLSEIDEEAGKEKKGSTPIFELLFWWTRKPLVVSRAAVLGGLLPETYSISDLRVQLGLHAEGRPFQYSPNMKRLSKIFQTALGKEAPKLLDPMAGGGSIPFEALRCGLEAIALEYNPVAFLTLKATLEYPHRFGDTLADDVEKWGMEVLRRAEDKIVHLYPKHKGKEPSHYVWCWVAECQRCGQKNPLMIHWWLVRMKNKRLGLKPILLSNRDFDISFTKNPPEGTVSRGESTCLRCGAPITNEHIREEISSRKRKLLCVVTSHKGKKQYEKPSSADHEALERAENYLKKKWKQFEKLDLIPVEEMAEYELNRVTPYGFSKWYELYSSRQLVALLSLADHIRSVTMEIEKKKGENYARVIATYLAITLSQHARRNSLPTTWQPQGEKIAHALSFRRPGMTWNHAEVNPFAHEGSGVWASNLSATVSAIRFASQALADASSPDIRLCSALRIPFEDREFDAIVTDPPYLDDVPYGELSEFYHVWLWRILYRYYPDLPGPKVPVDEELDDSPGRHGSRELSRGFYLNGLIEAFRQMHRVLKDEGILVLFFAHSKLEAWKILISSLVKAGFKVTMTWPVRTEPPGSVVQRGKASIQSSILVAATKRRNGGTAFLEDLRDKVAEHVKEGLQGISGLGLTGADLIVAGLGKALEVATSYSQLKSYSGNATLESLLEVVSEAVYSYSVERLVERPVAALDPQTAFYLFVKCGYGGIIPPDDALMLCKVAGIDLQALQHDRVVDKKKVGTRTILMTLDAYDRDLDIEKPPHTPSIIDQLHLLELAVKKGGKTGFDRLLSSPAFRAEDVRAVAEGLYNGLLLIKKNDPEIELLRPIIDLFKTGAPSPTQDTIDKYFTGTK